MHNRIDIAGGYFITRPARRAPDRSPDLLPSGLLSLSSCIAVFAPAAWALSWGGVPDTVRVSIATQFGIAESALTEVERFVQESMDRGDWSWPAVWHSVESALGFARRFCANADWVVLGAALEVSLLNRCIRCGRRRGSLPGS